MIHSFKDRRLEKFFRNGKTTAGIPSEIINAILCRLETLDNVQSERELLSNSLRYERLRMTSNRYSSIRVNSKYRWHCCKVSDEAAFCLIQRPYISKTLLTRRISPRGSP
uniref:type II toxin-antitoxin system RelE/ParE family toxin n=1 Tax=Escherichia coli TaxID=562 RepID=UPI002A5AC346|nr:type II toxin-antitoxin system RelE/ParE family toxin [Escherichia coli]WPB11775.1 hypothetical protein pVet7_000059 [Escherichia coli]